MTQGVQILHLRASRMRESPNAIDTIMTVGRQDIGRSIGERVCFTHELERPSRIASEDADVFIRGSIKKVEHHCTGGLDVRLGER